MNKKILKNIIFLTVIGITMLILTTVSNAVSLTITTSKSTVAPGESFSVTVTLNGAAGPVSTSVSNGTGSLGSQWLENSSSSFTCTAGSSGTVNISASGTVGDFSTGNDVPVSASKSVTIKQPVVETPSTPPSTGSSSSSNTSSSSSSNKTPTTTKPVETKKSDNSKLESLQIAEGTITPEFSSSVKEYAINLPNEVTKLSISAVADSSRATVSITGNEELQVGENKIQVVVTAEDGSKTTYTILATRADKQLNLQSLNIYYIDENGEKVVLPLEPVFAFDTYEYTLEQLKHTVKSLEIEAIANKENAKVEIIGNEEIKAGKNEITIKVTLMNEEGLEEIKTYKIIVEREEEPVVVPLTTMQKIKNWFNGAGTTMSKWATENFDRIISGMLLIATTTLIGLTIYFAYDYKNYQKLIAKLAQYNKENLMERANIALNPEIVENSIIENIEEIRNIEEVEQQEIMEQPEEKSKVKLSRGRRFK